MLTTKLTIPAECPIIALSDIHADIDALIIALRDCAKVITKNPEKYNGNTYGLEHHDGFCHTNIRLDAGDAFLEYLLNLDLNIPKNDEIFNKHCDLGYAWTGGASHVVIVGDILDGLRPAVSVFRKKCGHETQFEHQYPQIEVKILKFLNKLDECAEKKHGRVIKLVGNHEGMNFISAAFLKDSRMHTRSKKRTHKVSYASAFLNDHAFANTMQQTISTREYYNGKSRSVYFSFGHDGFELFRERGTAILLIINDIIFVHGNLNSAVNYEGIVYINDTLNGKRSFTDQYFNTLFYKMASSTNSILWDRESGNDRITSARLKRKDERHCIMLNNYIKQFCAPGLCNKDSVKLIIGHCPQNYTQQDQINTTISKIIDNDGTVTTYHAESLDEIYTGKQNPAKRITFGIAMECSRSTPEKETTNHIVYKVDTGISRAFDNANVQTYIGDPKYMKYRKYFMRTVLSFRTPQVLKIQNNLDYIIKSNTLNTRRHQPRVWLEELIDKFKIDGFVPALGLPPIQSEAEDTSPQGGGQYRSYVNYHKYMKYKKKYIEFKKNT
jgi:hypothetical protein